MLIYACISGHGFGHGSRTASVLAQLALRRPDWRLVVSSGLPAGFLDLAFGPVPFEHRRCSWDVGLVQADALGGDPEATLDALNHLDRRLPSQVDREATWLEAQGDRLLVLGDVPAAAALVARRLTVPLVWLASFGWDAIYRPMGGPFIRWADRCRSLYGQGDLLIRCPLSLPMDWAIPAVDVGVTSSFPRLAPLGLRRDLHLPQDRGSAVLISFGGLGMPLDPTLLARWPQHVFIGADPTLAEASNGRVLPQGVRPLDVMPLVGRLITKPGYSSFCEAFSQGVGIHLIHREGFAEAPVLEEALKRHGWHRILSPLQLQSGDWELDRPLIPPTDQPLRLDGAERAAETIINLAES